MTPQLSDQKEPHLLHFQRPLQEVLPMELLCIRNEAKFQHLAQLNQLESQAITQH